MDIVDFLRRHKSITILALLLLIVLEASLAFQIINKADPKTAKILSQITAATGNPSEKITAISDTLSDRETSMPQTPIPTPSPSPFPSSAPDGSNNRGNINPAQAILPSIPTVNEHTDQNLVLVKRVIDGDTIEIEGGQKVRYIGIDTPETVDPRKPIQCFGIEASNRNKELVENKKIRLEKDVSETDKYGRLLRYVYVGKTFVNLALVSEGFAHSSSYPPDVKYQSQLIAAERQARDQNLGLWSKCPLNVPSVVNSPTSNSSNQPPNCTIKGNISSSGEKIYHLKGCASYEKTATIMKPEENVGFALKQKQSTRVGAKPKIVPRKW